MLDIVTYPDTRLKKKCRAVENVDSDVKRLLDEMAETMYEAPGIGLAAPQVGSDIRAIVVDVGDDEETGRRGKLYKLVNPKVVKRSGSTETEEGCLSIPQIRATVKRSADVIVEALDDNGSPVSIEASGLLAVCLQHEIDHLDGVLFIDRLSTINREMVRSKLRKLAKEAQDAAA